MIPFDPIAVEALFLADGLFDPDPLPPLVVAAVNERLMRGIGTQGTFDLYRDLLTIARRVAEGALVIAEQGERVGPALEEPIADLAAFLETVIPVR